MLDDEEFNTRKKVNLKKLLNKANYSVEESDQILHEYTLFKEVLKKLNNSYKDEDDFVKMFEHIIYRIHECTTECSAMRDTCTEKNKIILHKEHVPIKFIHFF